MKDLYPQQAATEEWLESHSAQYAVQLAQTLRVHLAQDVDRRFRYDPAAVPRAATVRALLIQWGMLLGTLHVAGRLAQLDAMLSPTPLHWAARALAIDLDDLARRLVDAEQWEG